MTVIFFGVENRFDLFYCFRRVICKWVWFSASDFLISHSTRNSP